MKGNRCRLHMNLKEEISLAESTYFITEWVSRNCNEYQVFGFHTEDSTQVGSH